MGKSKERNPEGATQGVKRAGRVEAKTEAQAHYLMSMESNIITIGLGPAGTGKTFLAASIAAKLLQDKKISRIIVTRPAVESGRGLGFLPGKLDEKYAPYIAPVREVLDDWLGKSHVDGMLKTGKIECVPLEFMRGRTFDNAFVILDEAQNTTVEEMKMFVTRIGEWSRVVINGDATQIDIETPSGLEDVVDRFHEMSGVGICKFADEDCVRSGIAREILFRYRSHNLSHVTI